MDWPEAAQKGEWWAAGVNALALGALWLTRRSWRDEHSALKRLQPEPEHRWRCMAFFATLAAIVVLAGALRWRLAHSSLWWDEVWQARNASVGDWKPDRKNPGELRFVPTTWTQALWNYRKPTNHPPMALASKACHEIWRSATAAGPGEFNEFVLRFPGFVASLAAVAMLALVLRAWGLAGGGLVAAFLLAVHPWHIRYGVDDRGYTFLVPLAIAGLWAVWRACGPPARLSGHGVAIRPSALWWWVLGIVQALILWCHLLSIWLCLGLAAAGLWWICSGHVGSVRRQKLARFAAVHAVGAMIFLQLFAPNLVQAATWGEKNQDGRMFDRSALASTLTQVACGREVSTRPPPTLASLDAIESKPWAFRHAWWDALVFPQLALSIAAFSTVVGLVLAWRFRRSLFVPIGCLLGACALFLAVVAVTGFYFYPRFILAVVVPVALAIGAGAQLGIEWVVCRWIRGSILVRSSLSLGVVVALLCTVPYSLAVLPMIEFLQETPFTPLREIARVLRDARAQGAVVFGYGFGAEALQFYLPDLKYERNQPALPALEAALRDARASDDRLFVAVGYEELNRQNLPDGFSLLDTFEEHAVLGGLESQFTYSVRRSPEPADARPAQ